MRKTKKDTVVKEYWDMLADGTEDKRLTYYDSSTDYIEDIWDIETDTHDDSNIINFY